MGQRKSVPLSIVLIALALIFAGLAECSRRAAAPSVDGVDVWKFDSVGDADPCQRCGTPMLWIGKNRGRCTNCGFECEISQERPTPNEQPNRE